VFKRDLFTCKYCGRRPPEVVLEVDHIIPRAGGGSDDIENLVTACCDCNRGKAAKGLGDTVPAVDELVRLEAMQEMAERALRLKQQTDLAKQQREVEADLIAEVRRTWEESTEDVSGFQELSIKRFLARGLTLSDFEDAISSLMALMNRRGWLRQDEAWRYFCGACWKMIKEGDES
jgi:hypothetical protein